MISYPNIDPVAASLGPFNIFGHSIGPLEIHWYGLMYLVGFVGAWWLGLRRAKRADIGWSRQQVEDLIFYGAIGVILGGRIGYTLFYNLPVFIANPISIFYIWQGGMSFHGGLLGVAVAFYVFARKYGFTYFQVSDFIAPMVPIGLGAGRIGNFINHELWGRPMVHVMPWAFDYGDHIPRHPSSLYQALTNGLLLFIIMWWYSSKPRPRMAVTAVFLFCYGCFRFTTEFFRAPDEQLGFIAFHWLTMGQLLSVPMIILGIVIFWLAMKSSNKAEIGKP